MSKRFKYPTDPAILKKHLNTDKSVFVFNKWEEVVKYDEDGEKKPADPDEWKRYGPGPITHKASQDFADAIYDEIHAGYGFTPLLGAGFSVSAGIPIINQLKTYLQRCICVAMGVEDDKIKGNRGNYILDTQGCKGSK
jgi:hypothetical protein